MRKFEPDIQSSFGEITFKDSKFYNESQRIYGLINVFATQQFRKCSMSAISFVIACKKLKITQIAQINPLFQRLNSSYSYWLGKLLWFTSKQKFFWKGCRQSKTCTLTLKAYKYKFMSCVIIWYITSNNLKKSLRTQKVRENKPAATLVMLVACLDSISLVAFDALRLLLLHQNEWLLSQMCAARNFFSSDWCI